jgi:phosphate transport system protein
MTESRQEFDRELDAIEAKVIQLFAMVGEDLTEATRALATGDGSVFPLLVERDREIDALYHGVEELVQREILLQAPVAKDLRFLLSVLRITPELERTHDLIVQIAGDAGTASWDDLSPTGQDILQKMGDLAAQMWRQAADCWYQRDRATATTLAGLDAEMDSLHATLYSELAAGGMPARAIMELTLVGRCYRRLAAHAVNISRRVIYLAGPLRLFSRRIDTLVRGCPALRGCRAAGP